MAHKHAELMKQYAEDAAQHDKPWELWELRPIDGVSFLQCHGHPHWDMDMVYRRKPTTWKYPAGECPRPYMCNNWLITKRHDQCFNLRPLDLNFKTYTEAREAYRVLKSIMDLDCDLEYMDYPI